MVPVDVQYQLTKEANVILSGVLDWVVQDKAAWSTRLALLKLTAGQVHRRVRCNRTHGGEYVNSITTQSMQGWRVSKAGRVL
jgi:hypothetical protein